jgi:hypothetical protein
MRCLDSIIKIAFARHYKSILQGIEQPHATQQMLLMRLIKAHRHTAFGRQYNFESITSIRQFQERIPIQQYDDFKPYIQRMIQGEANILCPGKVRYFSKSSGTTSDVSKYIPVPLQNLKNCHLKGGHDAIAMWLQQQPASQIFDGGNAIIMGGELNPSTFSSSTIIGDVSAIMLQHLPFYARWFLTPDIPTALLPDWEEKIERIARAAVSKNITNISGVPTWTLLLMRKILEISGASTLAEVFPKFELYMHGGVNFEPYRGQFQALFPDQNIQFRNSYNASEGFFASQHHQDDVGMQLLLNNDVFFEFMPLDQLGKSTAKVHTIEEVNLQEDYALVISSSAGLWRYLIGDTLQFTSLYPHQISLTGRTQQFINVFGEEVMVCNAEKALVHTCQRFAATVADYTVAPVFFEAGSKAGHQWLIEFETPPKDINQFRKILDLNLQKVNSDYQAKRYKSLALNELDLTVLPKGTFHKWLKLKGKFGGQNKVPRLSNERGYAEEILALIQP